MSTDAHASLPWDALKHTEGDIPWPALEQFADALAADPALWAQLRKLYEGYFEMEEPPPSYEWLYVPAIAAMAAPRLGPDILYEIAEFLVGEILVAADEEDDVLLEVAEAACGAMGPVAVRPILDALDEMEADDPGWGSLWYMTELAAESTDAALRSEVAQRAIAVLAAEERGEAQTDEPYSPAYTLAKLKWTDARPLIERLLKRTRSADLRDALQRLDAKVPIKQRPEIWEVPVREWLESFWPMAHEDYESPPQEDEEEHEDEVEEGYEDDGPSYELEGGDGLEGEEEDVEPAPPVQAKPVVGRNDPCPCGSGKKYKKCCGR